MINYYQLLGLDPEEVDPDRDRAAIRVEIERMRGEWSSGTTLDHRQAAKNRERLDAELIPHLTNDLNVWREHRRLERERLKGEARRAAARLGEFVQILRGRGACTDDALKPIVNELKTAFPARVVERLLGGACDPPRLREWLTRRGVCFDLAPQVEPLDPVKAAAIFKELDFLVGQDKITTADLYVFLSAESGKRVKPSDPPAELGALAKGLYVELSRKGSTDLVSSAKLTLLGLCQVVLGDKATKDRCDLTLALRALKSFDTDLRLAAGKEKVLLPAAQARLVDQAAALGVSARHARMYLAHFAKAAKFTLVPASAGDDPPSTPAPSPRRRTLPRARPVARRREEQRPRTDARQTWRGVPVWAWAVLGASGVLLLSCAGLVGIGLTRSRQPADEAAVSPPTAARPDPPKGPSPAVRPSPPLPAPGRPPAVAVAGAAEAVARGAAAVAEAASLDADVRAAGDSDPTTRRGGAGRLASWLDHPDVPFRRRAAWTLAGMGADAEPAAAALRRALDDPDSHVRAAAGSALGHITLATVVAAARSVAGGSAASAAEVLAAREAMLALVPELGAREPEERVKALKKIAAFGDHANCVADRVIEAMQDKEGAVRAAAGKALEQINPRMHPHIVELLSGTRKRAAIMALRDVPAAEGAVPLLLRCHDNPALWGGGRPQAGVYFEDLFPVVARIAPQDKRFAAAVLAAVAAPNPKGDRTLRERRLAGIAQLRVIEATTADKVAALVAALEDGEAVVPVVQALERYGADARAALPALKKLKASPIEATRNAAISAIANIE